MRISDWSSDVCSSDLGLTCQGTAADERHDPHGLAGRRLQFARAFHLPAFQHELGTIAQDRSSVPDLPRHMRRDIGHRIGHGDAVVEMKFAGAAIVPKPVGEVYILLYLDKGKPFTNGMDGPGG